MAIRTDDEIRQYLITAWEFAESGDNDVWWALREKWHRGELRPLSQETDATGSQRPSTEAANLPRTESNQRESETADSESNVRSEPAPGLTRVEAWQRLRQLWDSIEQVDYGFAAMELQPLIEAEWPDVREAALRYQLVLEQRQWILSNIPQQSEVSLAGPFLRLLAMPDRLIGIDEQQFWTELNRHYGLADSFRMFCHRLVAKAPQLARERRELLENLKRFSMIHATRTVDTGSTTPVGTILLVVVAVVVPLVRSLISSQQRYSRPAPIVTPRYQPPPSTSPLVIPPVLTQTPASRSASIPDPNATDDPAMDADLRRLHELLKRFEADPIPSEENMPVFVELMEWQRSDPERLNKVRGERQRRLFLNPKAFDSPPTNPFPEGLPP